MQDEREVTVELERERRGTEIAPIRLAPDDLEPDTLRAVIESFVLREGTDYGVHETSLEDKVAQVLIQLRRGEAQITFDPATESVNVVVTSAIHGFLEAPPAEGSSVAGGGTLTIGPRNCRHAGRRPPLKGRWPDRWTPHGRPSKSSR